VIFLKFDLSIFTAREFAVILINPPPSISCCIRLLSDGFYSPIGWITLTVFSDGSGRRFDLAFVTVILAIFSLMKQSVLEYIRAPPSYIEYPSSILKLVMLKY